MPVAFEENTATRLNLIFLLLGLAWCSTKVLNSHEYLTANWTDGGVKSRWTSRGKENCGFDVGWISEISPNS